MEEGEDDSQDTQFCVELEDGQRDLSPPPSPLADDPSLLLGLSYSQTQMMKNEQAEKLDIMMTVCLEHFHRICHHRDGKLSVTATEYSRNEDITSPIIYSGTPLF